LFEKRSFFGRAKRVRVWLGAREKRSEVNQTQTLRPSTTRVSARAASACPIRAAPPNIDDVFMANSSYSWNTTKFTDGSHYLLCNGYRSGSSFIGNATENVTVRY
jgi:hypothetical protein